MMDFNKFLSMYSNWDGAKETLTQLFTDPKIRVTWDTVLKCCNLQVNMDNVNIPWQYTSFLVESTGEVLAYCIPTEVLGTLLDKYKYFPMDTIHACELECDIETYLYDQYSSGMPTLGEELMGAFGLNPILN